MKKKLIYSISAAIGIAAVSNAQTHIDVSNTNSEQCIANNKQGVNIIKEARADCGTGKTTCAGQNVAHEPGAWLFVPKGMCEQILAENWDAVSDDICDKLETCVKKNAPATMKK